MAEGDTTIDLDRLMSPLSRDDLELLLAVCIDKHPDCLDLLRAEIHKPVELGRLALGDAIVACEGGEADVGFPALNDIVERAQAYAEAGAISNSCSILTMLTSELAAVIPAAVQLHGDERLDQLCVELEQAWDATIAGFSDYSEMKGVFGQLAAWRQMLLASVGPILTEPLRTLKARIEAVRAARPTKRMKTDAIMTTTSTIMKESVSSSSS